MAAVFALMLALAGCGGGDSATADAIDQIPPFAHGDDSDRTATHK